MQKAYDSHENKNIRISFIRVHDRKAGYELEQRFLDKYLSSGKLLNVHSNSEINGHGRVLDDKVKKRLSLSAKRFVESGELAERLKAYREAKRRAVIIDGKEYPSMIAAAKALKIDPSLIRRRVLNEKFPNYSLMEKVKKQ
jgi:hypothetical protein